MSDMRDPSRDPMRDPMNVRDPALDPALGPADPTVTTPRSSLNWTWIIGGVTAAVLVLIALFAWTGNDQTVSDARTPAVTTGQAPSAPATAPATARRPVPADENTGAR